MSFIVDCGTESCPPGTAGLNYSMVDSHSLTLAMVQRHSSQLLHMCLRAWPLSYHSCVLHGRFPQLLTQATVKRLLPAAVYKIESMAAHYMVKAWTLQFPRFGEVSLILFGTTVMLGT